MYAEETDNSLFNINMINARFSPKKRTTKKCPERLFSTINAYLWLHGIGFTQKMNFNGRYKLQYVASILCFAAWEGNFYYITYINCMNIYDRGLKESQGELAAIIIFLVNAISRFQFYTQRKVLRQAVRKLGRVCSKISDEDISDTGFKLKMTAMLLINDFYIFGYVVCILSVNSDYVVALYSHKTDPSPYAIPIYYVSYTLCTLSLNHAAVSSFFYSICFVLQKSLSQFKERLEKNKEKTCLFGLYSEITEIILHVNNVMHPMLLTAFILLLSIEFQKAYEAIFLFTDLLVPLNFFFVLIMFVNFALICNASSSIIRATAEVQSASKMLSVDVTNSKVLQFFLQMNEGFSGFKIMDSITIDLSMIASSAGVLLTSGILIATFNTNRGG